MVRLVSGVSFRFWEKSRWAWERNSNEREEYIRIKDGLCGFWFLYSTCVSIYLWILYIYIYIYIERERESVYVQGIQCIWMSVYMHTHSHTPPKTHTHTHTHIYLYIVIHGKTVSLYHNSSVWLDT